MRKTVIVSAARTPIGSFGGVFKNISAAELGIFAAKEAIRRAGIDPGQIQEVLIGNVLPAGQGQGVARQIAIGAGIPQEIPAMGLNIICGSGLRTVSLAAQMIASGQVDIMLVGGAESMSKAPYLSSDLRWGGKMGDKSLVDSIINDGLTDVFGGYHMGITAENIAEKFNISREDQDRIAVDSQNRAQKAQEEGRFDDEIVPVIVKTRKEEMLVEKDEYIKYGTTIEKLAGLRPAFKKDGTVTAGNASGINDGAAMLVVMSEEKAIELGLTPLASIKSYATIGVDPSIMGIGPVPASRKALELAGLKIEDIDLVEANEAFAAQAVYVARELNLDLEKTNVNGGAIALGHPIGASGARILVTLLYEMKRRDSKRGLATLCIGGGMGTSLIVER